MATPNVKMVNSIFEVQSFYGKLDSDDPIYLGVGPNGENNTVSPIKVFLQVNVGHNRGNVTCVTVSMTEDNVDDLITALQYSKLVSKGEI